MNLDQLRTASDADVFAELLSTVRIIETGEATNNPDLAWKNHKRSSLLWWLGKIAEEMRKRADATHGTGEPTSGQ